MVPYRDLKFGANPDTRVVWHAFVVDEPTTINEKGRGVALAEQLGELSKVIPAGHQQYRTGSIDCLLQRLTVMDLLGGKFPGHGFCCNRVVCLDSGALLQKSLDHWNGR